MARTKRAAFARKSWFTLGAFALLFVGAGVWGNLNSPGDRRASVSAQQRPAAAVTEPFFSGYAITMCGDLTDAIAKYKLIEANALTSYQRDSCWLQDEGTQLLILGASANNPDFVQVRVFRPDGSGTEDAWAKYSYL